MRFPPLLIALSVVAGLAAAPAAMSAAPRDGGEPLEWPADRLDPDVDARTALLLGHVKLPRGPLTLRCPRVDVRYDQVPHVTWARGSGGGVAEIKGGRAEASD